LAHVLKILEPIRTSKTEAGSRLRSRRKLLLLAAPRRPICCISETVAAILIAIRRLNPRFSSQPT
jgi:hypothetical protein